MNTPTAACLARPVPLVRPLPLRWWEAVQDAWAAWMASVDRPPARPAVAEEWAIQDVAALPDALLRDIGVPEDLRAEAAQHREADRRLLLEIHAAANGFFLRQL